VREATAEVETNTGTVVKVFTTGTAVQVFLFGRSLPARGGSGSESATKHEKGVSTMLILSRKTQESVVVGGSEGFEQMLKVTVLEIRRGHVRLGFEAEAGIPVHRSEVWERIQAEGGPEKPAGEDVAPVA
jgi:carbon storage regulator CsrA